MHNRAARGERHPETFDFLGFTHFCRKTRKGDFGLERKPAAKRVTHTLKHIKEELRRRTHHDVYDVARWLGQVIRGWLGYYAMPTSSLWCSHFVAGIQRIWLKILRRRSQYDRFSRERMARICKACWPPVRIAHPWPDNRFAVKHLR